MFNPFFTLKRIFSVSIIIFTAVIIIIASLWSRLNTFDYILINFFQIVFFFGGSIFFFRAWGTINEKSFLRKLFWTGFFIRLISVFFLVNWFENITGTPFGPGNWDEFKYNEAANDLLKAWSAGNYDLGSVIRFQGVSDNGFPVYLAFVYSIFGNNALFIPRLLNIFLSSWSGVLLYKLFTRLFTEQNVTARLAAIFFMLMPNIIYYTGVHLKETLMLFMIILFFEKADSLLRLGRINIRSIVITSFLLLIFFFFRTVLGLAIIFTILTFFTLGRTYKPLLKFFIILAWVVLGFIYLSSSVIMDEVIDIAERRGYEQEESMQYRAQKGNELAVYGSTAIFAPVILIAPFPTFIKVEGQEIIKMLAGGYLIKNILSIFLIFSIFEIIKNGSWRIYLLPLSFVVIYSVALAMSSFALSERFHLITLPFWLAFAAYGLVNKCYKTKIYYNLYFIILLVLVIGWNLFKLAGRGLL